MNTYTWVIVCSLQVSQHHEPVSGSVGVPHGSCLRDVGQPPGHSHSYEGRDQRGRTQNPSGTFQASLCFALWRQWSLPSLCPAAGVFCCLLRLFSKHSFPDLSSRGSREGACWCFFGHYCLPEINHSFMGCLHTNVYSFSLAKCGVGLWWFWVKPHSCSHNAVTWFSISSSWGFLFHRPQNREL